MDYAAFAQSDNEFADRISIQRLDKICEVLDCDPHDLLEYVPPQKPDKSAQSNKKTL